MLNAMDVKTIIFLFAALTRINCVPQIQVEFGIDGVDLYEIDPQKSQDAIKNSSFIFYYGKSLSESVNAALDDLGRISKHQKFDDNKPVTLFLHGYKNNQQTPAVKKVVEAYISNGEHNLIVLDWADATAGTYVDAYKNVEPVGKKIAAVLLDGFRKSILKVESVFLVGHSLGAQLGGIIGRSLTQQSSNGTKLKRITGLDPAGPLFFPDLPMILPENHLSEDDATFVDIVHTDTGGYGYPLQTGAADFYVNSGYRFQPGCGTDAQRGGSCSHNRAVDFWVESVVNNRSFYAVGTKASSGWTSGWQAFKEHKIDRENIVILGIECPESADGRYYLQTNKASPFARGLNGIYFDSSLEE